MNLRKLGADLISKCSVQSTGSSSPVNQETLVRGMSWLS